MPPKPSVHGTKPAHYMCANCSWGPRKATKSAVSDWQKKIEELSKRLVADVPADREARTEDQHARWLLANVLDWHRRENKAVWWEYFRLSALSSEELMDERSALSQLAFGRGSPAAMTLHAAVLREHQRCYHSHWGRFDITNTGSMRLLALWQPTS
jgi:hypothetical protein